MRQRALSLLPGVLLAFALPALAAEPRRDGVDAGLRMAMERVASGRPHAAADLPVVLEDDGPGGVRARVLVRTRDVPRTLRAIADAGGSHSTVAGDVVVARLPLAQAPALASRAEVHSVQGSRRLQPLLDASRAAIGANEVHTGSGLPHAFTGRSVVVGVVDTGLDVSHPDFEDAAGTSRVLAFWDQSRPGKPPAGFAQGWECTRSDIDAGSCPLTDPASAVGHGTHVTGIAAGNGRARGGAPYRGVAPEADIVAVRGFIDEAGIIDGVRYVFEKAAAAGRPAVVNLSSGHHYGSHDGESSFERALAALLGPGRILVAAAGNEGSLPVHLGFDAQGSGYDSGTSTDVTIPSGTTGTLAYLVATSEEIRVGLRVSTPSGGQRVPCADVGPLRPGDRSPERAITCGGAPAGFVELDATERTGGGLPAFALYISNGGNGAIDLARTNWELFVFGDARVDGWVAQGGSFGTASGGRWRPGDGAMTIRIPATAPDVLTAGAFTTKLGWVDFDGIARTFLNLPSTPGLCPGVTAAAVGGAACFTSRGPSRDGRAKPDVLAPGQVVVAPLASTVDLSGAGSRLLAVQGGGYRAFQGTSMSAPHVAGVVALMLEADPTIGPARARRILTRTARRDEALPADDRRGAGRLDALAAVRAATGSATRLVPIVLDAAGLGGARFTTELALANRGSTQATATLSYTAAAALGAAGAGTVTATLGPGRQLLIPDAIAWLRSGGVPIPAGGASQGGTLRVTFTGLSSPDAGYAGARTTTPSGAGRAGLAYRGVAPEECFTATAWVHGLRHDASDRSNLALVNASAAAAVTLRVTLVDGGRSVPVSPDVTLGPGQWAQLSGLLAQAGLASASARVDLVSGPGPFFTYGVFNDNATNDGSYVEPRIEPAPERQELPVLVETPVYASELVLWNAAEESAAVRLAYAESLAASGGGGEVVESLGPLEERIVPDAIAWLRAKGIALAPKGSASFAGALRATFRAGATASGGFVGARAAAGRYGLFVPAAGASEAATADAWVFGLRQDASARSNVAVVNTADAGAAASYRVDVYDGETGALAGTTGPFTLAPGRWRQHDALLARFGVRNGYARVSKLSGPGGFLAYGVVNDGATPSGGGTNDGSYVPFTTP